MLLFCPNCSNMLTIAQTPSENAEDESRAGLYRFECKTCPYECLLERAYMERTPMKRKEVDDVMGGAASWENAEQTEIACTNEKCDNTKAYFYQVQIRSADEPMSSTYRCTKCRHEWFEF